MDCSVESGVQDRSRHHPGGASLWAETAVTLTTASTAGQLAPAQRIPKQQARFVPGAGHLEKRFVFQEVKDLALAPARTRGAARGGGSCTTTKRIAPAWINLDVARVLGRSYSAASM